MFARLKRKRDEEPLVPHGLIWQAIEEQSSEPMKSPGQKPSSDTPAGEVLEIPVQPAPAPEGPQRPRGAISPPLQWPSPNIQSVHRRAAIPQAPNLVASTEQPGTEHNSGASPAAATVMRESETRQPKFAATSSTIGFARAVPRLRSAFHSFITRTRSLTLLVLQRALVLRAAAVRRYEGARIGDQIARARSFTGTQLTEVSEKTRDLATIVGSKARAGWHAFLLHTQPIARNAIQSLGRTDTAAIQRALRRAWNLKVTVRIPASDSQRFIAVFRGTQSQWYSLRAWATRDSRLLISFGMGALSAILAVGLVTTLRHFEPTTSHGVVTADSKGADTSTQPRATGAIKPSVAVKNQKPRPTIHRQAQSTSPRLTAPPGNQTTVNTVKLKPRRSDDEDYIAKDTYVYYGNTGKPTRQ